LRGLPAELHQDIPDALPGEDGLDVFRRERFKIEPVGHVVVGETVSGSS
jgi:hypothetical protein